MAEPQLADRSLGELVERLAEQTRTLVRQELHLAQVELAGKKQVEEAVPPTPERALESVKADADEVKMRASRS